MNHRTAYTPTSRSNVPTLCLWAILTCGSAIFLQQGHLQQDVDSYRELAQNLCETHLLARTLPSGERCPTAYRPPLYPVALAALGGFRNVTSFHVAILHLGIGIAITVLTFQIGSRFNTRVAWTAALLAPLDPLLLRWSSYPMTEALATLLFLLVLRMGLHWHDVYQHSAGVYTGAVRSHRPGTRSHVHVAAMWGALLGLSVLCRPVFLAWALLLALCIALLRPRHLSLRPAATLLLGVAIVLAPWTFRNHRLVGVATPLTTHGGYTLLLSNNPFYYRHLREKGWREPWDANELQTWLAKIGVALPESCEAAEFSYDQSCRRLAIESMRKDPAMAAYASLVRALQLWSPLPHATSRTESLPTRLMRYAVAVWYLTILLTAVRGLSSAARRQPFLVALGLSAALAFTLVHLLYFSNMRMRTPLMPWWTIMAAVQVDRWIAQWMREEESDTFTT